MANLLAVPIGADQIGLIVHGFALEQPAGGTASNASRVPRAPFPPAAPTTQTTALARLVPFEVTTGEPEV